jgi:hypothetical protein
VKTKKIMQSGRLLIAAGEVAVVNDTQKITKISSGNKLGSVSDVKAKVFIKNKSHSQKFFKMVAFVIDPEWIKQEITHFIKSSEHLTNYS